MPKFYIDDCNNDPYIEIDTSDFYDKCTPSERRALLGYLIDDDYIEDPDDVDISEFYKDEPYEYSTSDQLNQWGTIIGTLECERTLLTIEEETTIRNIAKRINPKIR